MSAKADIFWATYAGHLESLANNGHYNWPASEAADVAARMRTAWEKGSASKDGKAFAATCKSLGIKHTYKAMRAYIAGEQAPEMVEIDYKGTKKKVVCFARFDYVLMGHRFNCAVTPAQDDIGVSNKSVTHVASGKRICALAVCTDNLAAFASARTDAERGKVAVAQAVERIGVVKFVGALVNAERVQP